MFRVIRDHWLPSRGAYREHRLVPRLKHSAQAQSSALLLPLGHDRGQGEKSRGKGGKRDEARRRKRYPDSPKES